MLIGSWALFAVSREWQIDVLPAQSERPFPLLVWQVLFVNGMLLGWHRDRVARWVGRRRTSICAGVLALAAVFAFVQVAGAGLLDAATWAAWEAEPFDKGSLNLARILGMTSIAAAIYLALRRHAGAAQRTLGPVLLPLGRPSTSSSCTSSCASPSPASRRSPTTTDSARSATRSCSSAA